MKDFIEILEISNKLEQLSMIGCSVDDTEVSDIVGALRKSGCPLKTLDLTQNNIGLRGGLAIAHALIEAKKKSLQSLRLSKNTLSELPVTEVILALDSHDVNLDSLYLDNCVQDGDVLPVKEVNILLEQIITKRGARFTQLALSHINVATAESVCEAISKAKLSLKYLELSSLSGLEPESANCPFKLSTDCSVQTLSLINNKLTNTNVKGIAKYWRINRPGIEDIVLSPGNGDVTAPIEKRLLDCVRGVTGYDTPTDATTSSSEDESDSEAAESPKVKSAPESSSAMEIQTPVSSVSAKSDLMSDSEKADSEKAENEKKQSEKNDGKDSSSEKATSRTSSSSESETETDSETESESKKPKVTLDESSEEPITPRASLALIKLGEDTDNDISDITAVASDTPLSEHLRSGQSDIRLSQLDSDQIKKLCTFLKSNSGVKVLKIQDANLGSPKVLTSLTKALKDNSQLKELVLAGCELNQESCPLLEKLVADHISTLEVLSLRDNPLGDSGTEGIVRIIANKAEEAYNSKLHRQAQDIASRSLTDAVRSDSLASMVSQGSEEGRVQIIPPSTVVPPPLHTLVLSNCKVGNAAVSQIVKLIKYGNLKDLRLSSTSGITQYGWKDLLTAACSPKSSVRSLDISSNLIGKFGVATGSPLNCIFGAGLDYLNMSGCLLSNEHVQSLVSQLERETTSIKEWTLTPGNDLTEGNITQLQQACR
ncbi:hypothetical protein EB796_007149 [Bugula neritina]|uniref:Uncharacterized protein n=1 Tax=Bugula neritina TaxID=10212 RepID=A0A7J7K9L5_BUGNE|nr:hypothetical protein EB796_007149 [Bugula neritina]